MDKLIEFVSSFKNLNLKEIVFREANLLPFLIGSLILIIILKWLINTKSKRRASLGVSSLAFFKKRRLFWKHLPEILFISGIILLIFALLNPVLPLVKNKKNVIAKEIMLVLDCSSSMEDGWKGDNPDWSYNQFYSTKLEVEIKHVIGLIETRKHDVVGLIIYSDNPYLLSPFTNDYALLTANLKLIVNMGLREVLPYEGSTATGEALLLANEYLKEYGQSKERIIILFTDGESNTGRKPEQAFREIQKSKFKVFILGIQYYGSSDAADLVQKARETNGGFFSIDSEQDLKQAVAAIDRLVGKNKITIDEYSVDDPRYFYFVFSALILFVLSLFLKHLPYFRDLL
jgi:Ca-activated chloride channel family protein